MMLITLTVLFGLIHLSLANGDCVIPGPTEVSWEKQLVKDIKCNYRHLYPPKPGNSDPLDVNVKFVLKYFSFSTDEEVLKMHTWLFLSWTDDRLKWDPSKYGGLEEIEIESTYIWTPSLSLLNTAVPEDFDRYFFVHCTVKKSGLVLCVPRVVYPAICSVKMTNFPYDAQECNLEFGPWEPTKFNLNFSSKAITMLGADYGSSWFISDYRQKAQPQSKKQLIMTFVLEREALSLAAVIVYPSLIISALTLACLLLDVRHNVRLALICFSIFSHYYFLVELGEIIPKESSDPPKLLLYYRGSLAITMFLLLKTFMLVVMSKKQNTPPSIVISINGFVYSGYARFLMFPRWDTECLVITDENRHIEDWTKFVNSLNSVCGIIIVVAYISLYFSFMPQPLPINY